MYKTMQFRYTFLLVWFNVDLTYISNSFSSFFQKSDTDKNGVGSWMEHLQREMHTNRIFGV